MATLDHKSILLVHPLGYCVGDAGNDIARFANIMPPIGLASLAAWLDRRACRRSSRLLAPYWPASGHPIAATSAFRA
jgi:hypothetical protein